MEQVEVFRALADATRQRMLLVLEKAGEMCVTDIARHFALTQPSISHHLRVLRQAGLVTARREGKEIFYSLNADALTRCCGTFFANFACCQPLVPAEHAPAPASEPATGGGRRRGKRTTTRSATR